MNFFIKKLTEINCSNSLPFLYLFFLAYLLILSFGAVSRYDLLGHIGAADRFLNGGVMYPSFLNGEIYQTVSEYFPGLAFLSIFFGNLMPKNILVEFMHVLSVFILIYFLFIQKKIIEKAFPKINTNNYWPFAVIFCVFFVENWVFMALSFKADTIALCFGLIGLLLANLSIKKKSNFLFYFGSFFFGFGLIFKQQYIAALVALIFFGFFKKDKKILLFSFIPLLIFFCLIFYLKNNNTAWHLTIGIFFGSKFFTSYEWLQINHPTIKKFIYLSFFIFSFYRGTLKFFLKKGMEYIDMFFQNFLKSPFLIVLLFSSIAALVSSFKAGANRSNTELAIAVLLPFIYVFFSYWTFVWVNLLLNNRLGERGVFSLILS